MKAAAVASHAQVWVRMFGPPSGAFLEQITELLVAPVSHARLQR
jgi:hypothetical protein